VASFDERCRVSITARHDLSRAHVKLPPPFSGTANFAAPRLWTGTLAASFAGAPDFPMAGAGFKAKLKRF
jgi:hypothetical protein